MMDKMVHVQKDLTRGALETGIKGGSLADALKARQSGVFSISGGGVLVVDTSSSMSCMIEPAMNGNECVRAIDRLRDVVAQVRSQCPAEMVSFGATTGVVSDIEEPGGSTPLTEALEIAAENGFHHLVVISDGQPNDPESALACAKKYKFRIDTCFIGVVDGYGEEFLKELASKNGGKSQRGDLKEPLQLTGKLVGLLGDGKKVIEL